MPTTIKYSNNPNSDTAFVVQDSGQKNRAVLTAEPAGTLQLSDSANVSTGYVTDEDGKKHKVNLVAQLEGDIEFSENPNSTKGYATVDGKKHRVVLTASLAGGGGSAPVIDELNVTPTTSAQTITAPSGTDGYSPVKVSAVTSAIDANISAGNIKKDVTILGVTGSYEGVAPSGTKNITTNGIHDVAGYANADVQVPTTAPAHYIELQNNNGNIEKKLQQINFTGITSIGNYTFAYLMYGVKPSSDFVFSFSPITSINSINAFMAAFSEMFSTSSLAVNHTITIDMSTVTSISGIGCFDSAFALSTPVSSGELKVLLPNLETIGTGGNPFPKAFSGSPIKTISFDKLSVISSPFSSSSLNQTFKYCYLLESVSFGGLKSTTFASAVNQIQYLFNAQTGSQAPNGCTVHFPSNFDPDNPNKTFDITTLTGYPTFGGNANYIHLAFDLPATE